MKKVPTLNPTLVSETEYEGMRAIGAELTNLKEFKDSRELKELKTEIATEPETEYDKFRKNHIKEEDSEDNKK
jgi:hypothetical protein